MTPSAIQKIFETLKKNNPAPTTELIFDSDFELLIAVMLSAQATDISVNKATAKLFKNLRHSMPEISDGKENGYFFKGSLDPVLAHGDCASPSVPIANTPEKMVELGEEGLKKHIKTINYYPTKAKHIIKTCQILIEKFHSTVPNKREQLESLPGVGRKTANVILNTAFGESTIAVDTHIFRVANRIGLTKGKTPREVEDQLTQIIPKKYLRDAHHWLVLHGRYICTARNPKCSECPIEKWCYKVGVI